MLLTAQRVISPQSGRWGVNVYQYVHGDSNWGRVPVEFLPEVNPGELVEQWIEVRQGGNRVLSFLDVVAPDELLSIDLLQRLASLKHQMELSENPSTAYLGPLWARFGCVDLPIPRVTELGALAGHLLLCVSGARPRRVAG